MAHTTPRPERERPEVSFVTWDNAEGGNVGHVVVMWGAGVAGSEAGIQVMHQAWYVFEACFLLIRSG
ncbi:hypothetical protein ACSSV1_002731 [Labrenzia sp. MBR-25]